MKHVVISLCLYLSATAGLWAQSANQSNPQLFTGAAAVQQVPGPAGGKIYLQVGAGIPYGTFADTISVRFPWDVLYIPITFTEDAFEVSKGYYSDRIQVDWTVQSNASRIDRIVVYRRPYTGTYANDTEGYAVVATLAADAYTYRDTNIQGGKLYEYKIVAEGVSAIEEKYTTYITGIGYRNPTGVVTGSVTFNSGSPVRDVMLRADPQGTERNPGSTIQLAGNGRLHMHDTSFAISNAVTLQAWVKLQADAVATTRGLFNVNNSRHAGESLNVGYSLTDAGGLTVYITQPGSGNQMTFNVADYYPTGEVDGRGYDALAPFSAFDDGFVHFSVVLIPGQVPKLYLNGRPVSPEYVSALPADANGGSHPHISIAGNFNYAAVAATDVLVADGLTGYVDEVRMWSVALQEARIRTDFKRYLGGTESGLAAYLRCDERAGTYAYDISRVGFDFNKNHARIENGTWSQERPVASQLGVLGVTDENGNYIISAIPYMGSGESYTITPMLGVHQFEPAQQLVYIGNGSEVVNQIRFNDISSFHFLGTAYYTTDGVFAPLDPAANVTPGSVSEAGYNQYTAQIDGHEQLISKGEYYWDNVTDILYHTPTVFVQGANVYIDGNIVLDRDKRPVVTGPDGRFDIQVPIGKHYIEVKKDKHSLKHGGRFPAARADGQDLFEFFEHQQSAVTFLDTTRVQLVGRVAGGTREAAKPVGFGYAGPHQYAFKRAGQPDSLVTVSSVNNIGVASLTLTYLPYGATPGIGELTYSFKTHPVTGEYKVSVLPLSYTLNQPNGVRIENNPAIQLLAGNEILDLSKVPDTVHSEYKDSSGTLREKSDAYHFQKNFIYRSVPTLAVLKQTSLEQIAAKDAQGKDVSISTEGFQYPVYKQFDPYFITFQTKEVYTNYDAAQHVTDEVPVSDGQFNITNNLALTGTESLTVDANDKSLSTYKFQAGVPAIEPPFTRTIDIRYRVAGQDFQAVGYEPTGIILGGKSDGSQTFVTDAIAFPDIILRDPPGSNSFASIEKGSSLTVTQSASQGAGVTAENSVLIRGGMKVSTFGFFGAPVVETENLNNVSTGLSVQYSSTDGGSLSKTYTFNETISTSDDPQNVGSDADLYIGNSKNFFYGTFDNVEASPGAPAAASLQLTNGDGQSVYINKKKAFIFKEEPSNTFFVFSQKHILETLIPELQAIVDGLDNGSIPSTGAGAPPLSRAHYLEQIRQWRWVIQENERTKYQAIYDRAGYKAATRLKVMQEMDSIGTFLNRIEADDQMNNLLTDRKALLEAKQEKLNQILSILDAEFEQNISFDAGAGEYTRSVETSVVQGNSRTLNLALDPSIETNLGFTVMSAGIIWNSQLTQNNTIDAAVNSEASTTFQVSYTLKDNDAGNFLSVDVVNAFDGNGPIFSTLGGRTSCPYEGIDTTLFYNQADYQAAAPQDKDNKVFSGGERISYATQSLQSPAISVEVASVTDVPEARAAEFTLILENNNPAGVDGPSSYFDLWIDNTTNPHNAIMNIDANGTSVYVPYGKKTEFKLTLRKSVSDVYSYNDIAIYLLSQCDPANVYDAVTVSATFRPSCTAVQINPPLDNWVVNAGDVFNADQTTNPLPVSVSGYDRAFASFKNFDLQYRMSTASTWTTLGSYYNSQALLDAAVLEGKTGVVIGSATTTYPWDIGGMGLADGTYQLRAVSFCSNGTQFVSDVVNGTVDLNVPRAFGTPTPADGILGPGEDISMKFSEDILFSSAVSRIEIKGETNQQKIDHDVSIHFEGAANTVVLEKPNVVSGSFSMEFWMLNQTAGTATLLSQPDVLSAVLNNGALRWTLGANTVQGTIVDDGLFHHYTLTYNDETHEMRIYEDDHELGYSANAAGVTNVSSDALTLGGNTFVGNLHDLRLWATSLSLADAYAAQYKALMGTERNLVGYWPMNEGHGTIASDLARYKHAAVNAQWDIKPRGTAYAFANSQYLELDDVNFVQLTGDMDVTLSFWIKTSQQSTATIFSNGRGNGEDQVQSNGKANKWSVDMQSGILYLRSEGQSYKLTESPINDDRWHHVAIVLRRLGTLRTFVDASQVSSVVARQIGGLSGNKFWVGARGFINTANAITTDQTFTGKIDELCLWKLARAPEQIDRDRYNEIDFNSLGLMLYARMNEPDPPVATGPAYYHAAANETMLSSAAKLSSGAVQYTTDAPGIRPAREYLSFNVTHVINGDEIILTPEVTDWSVLEGQIIDITVAGMFDRYGNQQRSPVTWSAYVRRNEVAWYVTEGGVQNLQIEKQEREARTFEITLQNKGGRMQPYTIENIPAWLSANATSGTLSPNSTKTLTFTISPDLTVGEYTTDLLLHTDFNFDEKIVLNLRVLGTSPAWTVDPSAYEYSMSIIGKIRIDGSFSNDPYTRIAAFAGGAPRGVASLEYDANYDEYFVYLNIFSNTSSGEAITFRLWDAANGKIYQATMNGELSFTFLQNEVIGIKSAPVIFENTSYVEQDLLLNPGWTWISLHAEDKNLGDLNALTSSLTLADDDLIKGQLYFDVYDHGTGWNGTLTNTGGLHTSSMYKVRLTNANTLVVGGNETNVNVWKADLQAGWNWLAYPLANNVSVDEALAFLRASEGDVIKSQRSFAIYDPLVGWSGTLRYLLAGEGYMLKAALSQEFRYPDIFSQTTAGRMERDASPGVKGWQHYEHNMNVIVEAVTAEAYDSVFVTDRHGIIRGKTALVQQRGGTRGYITVFGNGDEEALYFSLGNSEGKVPANASFHFSPDAIMGTVNEPVRLSVSRETGMTVFPNVFSRELYVQFYAQREQETEINLVDQVGRTVYTASASARKGFNQIEVQPDIPGGLYMLGIVADGRRQMFKVIKK